MKLNIRLKTFLIPLFCCIALSACTPHDKTFFDYDTIDYYSSSIDEDQLIELDKNKSRSLLDSLKEGVLLGDIPGSLSDTLFIGKLEQMGYKKRNADTAIFPKIDEIFIEKELSASIAAACIYIYRDILVFRKNNAIVGTAKICFGCMANQINGAPGKHQKFRAGRRL